ncbi:hypothetical protein IT568_08735 [bacterium]|nr:hypothetical protein [bacterium]
MNLTLKLTLLSSLVVTTSVFAEDEFFTPKTTVGGYGELHYNYEKKDGSDATKILDFHRFVTFFSHSWTEKWSFKSEVELEHNFVEGAAEKGELELEQAYVNYHCNESFGFQAGVVLASIGLINEYHEPPTFLSVERSDYNNKIIPTTWFGNGIAFYGRKSGFDYKFTVMEGLDGKKISASKGIRDGRQKGFKSNAEDFLYNARLDYTGFSGLRVGTSFSFNDATVGKDTTNSVSILELHAKYEANDVYTVFEVANITYGDKDLAGVETSFGYYLDFGYNFGTFLKTEAKIIPWLRFEDYNTAKKAATEAVEKANHYTNWKVGVSVKPIESVVFKVDYGVKKQESTKTKTKQMNLGVGYQF